jgi:DNA-binding NarL/FixJ family response regulator
VLPRELLKQLVAEMVAEERPPDLSGLGSRKREDLELVAKRLSNAQIAKRLYLSESTVKQHLRIAYRALEGPKQETGSEFSLHSDSCRRAARRFARRC